jgi:dienelactone hydrolase
LQALRYKSRMPRSAPVGDLATFEKTRFAHTDPVHGAFAYDVYRKGAGPAVLVLTEMPGISPMVLGFADRVVALGLTAVLPDLFGEAGRDPLAGGPLGRLPYNLRSMGRACIRREFTVLATGKSSPIVAYLRALGAAEHARCGGPGIGVVGMCFTGGFALAMSTDPRVLAPVLSQPSLPFGITASRRASIDCAREELEVVKGRCAREGLRVLGLRFEGDPAVPPERFDFLRRELGDAFVAVELKQADRHPDGPLPSAHSVLTADLVDEPGSPTREALDRVLALFRTRLLPSDGSATGQSSSNTT